MSIAMVNKPASQIEDKLIPFNDQLETVQQTINLLMVPNQISEYSKKLDFIMSEVIAIKEFVTKSTENLESGDHYMTPAEAMKYLRMSPTTFDKYRYKTKFKIQAFQLDGSNRYKKSDLDRFMLLYQSSSQGPA
jgi:hypothetical protein